MDASQSALDSLRTVEFRETLKGYHRDDVDEYLEKAAVEAEGLQEQLRQTSERLRQAAERIAQLESELSSKPATQSIDQAAADDTLQRTLLLAQKFVDETKAESEAQAIKILSEADAKARQMTEEAKEQATHIAAEAERRLRAEITRLESQRLQLTTEVDTMARHLDGERARLRSALTDILAWVDKNVNPSASPEVRSEPERPSYDRPSERSFDSPSASSFSTTSDLPRPSYGESSFTTRTDTPSEPAGDEDRGGDVTPMRPTGLASRPTGTSSSLPY